MCPLKRGVRLREVSAYRGLTVFNFGNYIHVLLKCVPGILKSFRSASNTFKTLYIAKCYIYFCLD
jgi:CRISPR/Cas system-associated exonuclease Cas4 (RecB family)